MSGQTGKPSVFESRTVLDQGTYLLRRKLQLHWSHARMLYLDVEAFSRGTDTHFRVRAEVKQHKLSQLFQESAASLSGIHFASQYHCTALPSTTLLCCGYLSVGNLISMRRVGWSTGVLPFLNTMPKRRLRLSSLRRLAGPIRRRSAAQSASVSPLIFKAKLSRSKETQ